MIILTMVLTLLYSTDKIIRRTRDIEKILFYVTFLEVIFFVAMTSLYFALK